MELIQFLNKINVPTGKKQVKLVAALYWVAYALHSNEKFNKQQVQVRLFVYKNKKDSAEVNVI